LRRYDHRRDAVQQSQSARLAEHPRAGVPRHRVIAEHEVISCFTKPVQAFLSVRGFINTMSLQFERRDEHAPDIVLVLDDQYPRV